MTQNVLKNQVTELEQRIGLDKDDRRAVADAVSDAVSDTYRLFIMTQGVHWNVQGPLFYSVHKLTEAQYEDMFEAIDDLAERIRALGLPAPQTISELTTRAELAEPDPSSELVEQIDALASANEAVTRSLRRAVALAEERRDVRTADMLTKRIGVHEENVWMLRATIAS